MRLYGRNQRLRNRRLTLTALRTKVAGKSRRHSHLRLVLQSSHSIDRMPRMMRTSRVAVLVIAVLMLGSASCTMWGEKKKNSWKTVTAGEELTRLYWQ